MEIEQELACLVIVGLFNSPSHTAALYMLKIQSKPELLSHVLHF